MKVWIVAEQFAGKLEPVSYELLQRARDLGAPGGIGALVVGPALSWEELEELIARGADTVLAWESDALKHFEPEAYSACLEATVREFAPEIVLGGATAAGRTWMPYSAMRLATGLTADCTLLEIDPESGLLLQTRPAIGGNIMATIRTPARRPQMATVRPRSTSEAEVIPMHPGQIIRRRVPAEWLSTRQRPVGFVPSGAAVELATASRVVAVGRGVKKPENIKLARQLADALGAALGATREVVDRGWLPYSCQIGLSGRTVTPDLYVGLGVSGAIQHLAGMQTAKRIVAVNTDPEAQIFAVADFGIVGNLTEAVPALIARLARGGEL